MLKPTERDNLLIELKTALVGIEGTEDNGIVGDVKEIKKSLGKVKIDVAKNTTWRKAGMGIIGSLITVLISKLQGLW